MVLCVQVVQTNNNESRWKKSKEIITFNCRQVKDMWDLLRNQKNLN
jgi:hypothetical protein